MKLIEDIYHDGYLWAVWHDVPKEITLSSSKAEGCYSDIKFDQIPATLDNGGSNTEHRVLLRGALRLVIEHNKWENSKTYGGYVEAVITRYIKLKYGNDFSKFESMENITLRDIVKKLRKKYWMHRCTCVAVLKRVRNNMFEYSGANPLWY